MLPKKHRLTSKKNIRFVLQNGKVRRLPFLSVYFLQKEPPVKVAVVVGKKVDKKAVARNKIKRRIREALQQTIPYIIPGLWMVVVAQKKSAATSQQKIKKALLSIFSKDNQ